MLSFKFISSAGGAAHYFENSDDYYSKDGQKGSWEGEGAKLLNLQGGVDTAMFRQLLEGKLPNGQQVRTRMAATQKDGKKSKPRLGIDFTFSAPKSVSIAALVSGDRRLLQAHDEAVRASIKQLEEKAIGRKKEGGISFRQKTGNLTVATFRHDLSRSQDPQLHTHAVAMNLTQRRDGKWVAVTNDEMLKSIKVIGAYYRAELAQRLLAMGYEIRATRNGFELASISDQAIKLFSKRSAQIEDALEQKKLTRETAGTQTKQQLTQATRPNKTDADRAALREDWIEVLNTAGIKLPSLDNQNDTQLDAKGNPLEIGKTPAPKDDGGGSGSPPPTPAPAPRDDTDLANRAVDYAIEHLMERQGIFTKSELLERAYMRSLGAFKEIDVAIEKAIAEARLIQELPLYQSAKSFSRDRQAEAKDFQHDKFKHEGAEQEKLTASSWIALAIHKGKLTPEQAKKLVEESIANGRLVKVEERFTTGNMLNSENKILRLEEEGRGSVQPIMSADEAAKLLQNTALNEGQKEAARLILTTNNRIIGIQGYAGVGKSKMLADTLAAIEKEAAKTAKAGGYEVIGLAPYTSQNKALAELGMDSQTLASFLLRGEDQARLTPKTIVFLDEASVVPVHQMRDLLEKIEKAGARIALIGDRMQTQAVEAGKPFEQLQDSGMATAHITDIQRQLNEQLKAAVESAAKNKIPDAVRKLESRTTQIKTPDGRYQAIALEYTSLTIEERNRTLIVAGTNDARQAINAQVRQDLNLGDDHKLKTYNSIDMTRAEKKQAGSYSPGQVLVNEGRTALDLVKGQYYEIVEVADKQNLLLVKGKGGELITIDPSNLPNLSAFTKDEISVAPGDWIRVTRNNTTLGINNGQRHTVVEIKDNAILLSNGTKLPLDDRLHLQHGYASTVNSAQGLTSNRVLIDADTKSLTSNRAVFYVAISRAKYELHIFTDNKKKLAEVMSRDPKKYAARELRREDNEAGFLASNIAKNEIRQAFRNQQPEATKKMDKTSILRKSR